jgi:hypothetical protein
MTLGFEASDRNIKQSSMQHTALCCRNINWLAIVEV